MDTLEKGLALSRILVVVPTVVLVLAAALAFGYGTDIFIESVTEIFHNPLTVGHKLGLFLIEIDLFLIGATMIIAAFGLYELFISKIDQPGRFLRLPRWLEVYDLEDLKARVISMIILVAAVSFVDVVVNFENALDTLYLGAGVALVVVALTAFLRFGSGSERR